MIQTPTSPTLPSSTPAPPSEITIESVHRDLATANTYRIELIKLLLALAAALLAFTVTFRPSLHNVELGWLMFVGWIALAASTAGGIGQMLAWEYYYKSYRDYDWKLRHEPEGGKAAGEKARKRITRWRKRALALQLAGFLVGVSSVAAFAGVNIDSARPASVADSALVTPAKKNP